MESAILRAISAAVLVYLICITQTEAHGRLIEPPSRSSMWRFGFGTPRNYDDNQLFCGGFNTQWGQNGGRCGVCGDPYNGVRENEAGGRFATGTIARRYREGETITVTLDITVNHGGWFEFRICPNNDPRHPATESCLNQNLLRQPNGQTRWQFPSGSTGKFSYSLVLPGGLTCTQCVMQWKWNTASNWGCDSDGCGRGHGSQEQFLGCADVAISSSATSGSSSGFISASSNQDFNLGQNLIGGKSDTETQVATSGGNGFIPIGVSSGTATDEKCEATADWKTKYIFADQWCRTQCPTGNCPSQYCLDDCRHQ